MKIGVFCGCHLAGYEDGRDDPACVKVNFAGVSANMDPDIAIGFGRSLLGTAYAAKASNNARRRAQRASEAAQAKAKQENARHQ